MEPRVGPFSTMKLSRPVRMVDTDQAGFHVSGWKSVMERHSLRKNKTVRLETCFCQKKTDHRTIQKSTKDL